VIGAFSDTNLTTLTLAGTSPITLTSFQPSATMTIINTDTGAVTIPTWLNATAATSETIMNNGTGTMTIGATNNNANSLATLTLIGSVGYSMGNIAITTAASASGSSITVAATNPISTPLIQNAGLYNANGQLLGTLAAPQTNAFTSFSTNSTLAYSVASAAALTVAAADTALTTVNAASDNSAVNLWLGANSNAVTISLGNGTNRIVDDGTGGLTATLGTGGNTVVLPTGTNTITFGTHTGTDTLNLVNVPTGASTSLNLTTVNGFNLGTDKVNLSIQAFAAGNSTTTQLVYGLTGSTGIFATDSSNSTNLIANTPTIVNFPTVAGAITNGSIYSFGSTVYTVASLASFLNSTAFTYTSNTLTSGTFAIPALVTFGDGVHLELIKLSIGSGTLSTLNNVNVSGISDMVDFVGTTIGSATTMANSISFVL